MSKQALLFEKRSKNFYPLGIPGPDQEQGRSQYNIASPSPLSNSRKAKRIKVFCFFFSKKNYFL
jgi:hypothetical protein